MRIVAEPLTAQAFKPSGTVLTVLDGPATFAVFMRRDGTAGAEEFVPLATPPAVVLP